MSEETRVVWLVVALVALATLVPALTVARPANEIPVEASTASPNTLLDPGAEAWAEVPPVEVALTSAPSTVPNADATSVESVSVQAARTDGRLLVRLSWADATNDSSSDTPRAFEDAAAVQVPVNSSARPGIAMGSPRNLVNVWYWHGNGGNQELLAGGVGSTTQFDESVLQTQRQYRDGRWTVVYSRPLESQTSNRSHLAVDHDVDVAFAVWNGSNMERSGRKSVSEWYHLAFTTGVQGPPWESILWTVAGLAIGAVVLLSGHAVWKTREGEHGD
jgi:complex iron-sulfur molybdoenzyme family reductase subunit gamma